MELKLTKGNMNAVVTDAGAELISFTDGKGMEYIWGGDPAYWGGRNPVLFPVVGGLVDNQIKCKGETYTMGRHGFARNSVFAVADRGEDYVEFRLVSDAATWEKFPYDFDFRVRHTLHENGFSTAFTVINSGKEVLPCCVGAHTAFRCPMKDGESFSDYEIFFPEEETCPTRLLNGAGNLRGYETLPMLEGTHVLPLDYAPFAELDTLIFDSLKSKFVTLRHKTEGHGVTMEFADFPLMAFWTNGGKRAPYICIEPWMGHAGMVGESGNMEDKPYVMLLQPEESRTLTYAVTVNP